MDTPERSSHGDREMGEGRRVEEGERGVEERKEGKKGKQIA